MPHDEPLIRDLLGPEAYPHPVHGPVQHIQTHISHVLLTGEYAYKIKKPVDLGFLDYSTLERRKTFCEREVALNRPFAPNLYLETVPIYKTPATHTLIPDGDIVEYAVKMHQFNERDVLLQVFQRGELTDDDGTELARSLARIHAQSHTDDAVAAFGDPDAIRNMARGNFDVVRPFIGQTVPPETFEKIESTTFNFFETHRELFLKRVQTGRIRECHGDLHLNNICRYEGRLQFFDRIEFNETYKNIDVIYDLAFLLMDIQFRGRAGLATLLLNEYLEQTGDYEGALLLPVYRSMRAFIRGEVQSILANESEVDDETRNRAAREARRYFDSALAALKPGPPRTVLVGGVSGSGKSHLARQIAPPLGAIHLRSDAVRKHLAGTPLLERRDALYSESHTRATYNELAGLAQRLAGEGHPVLLDATYLTRRRRAGALDPLRRRGIPTAIVFCTAPERELRQRIEQRRGDASDATVDVMLRQLPHVELPEAAEADQVLVVDTTQTGAVNEVLDALTRPDR